MGADPPSLAQIALNITKLNAVGNQNTVQGLLNSNTNPAAKPTLSGCIQNYQDAGQLLDDSLRALASQDYKDVMTWVAYAEADGNKCEIALIDLYVSSPITPKSDNFRKLCMSTADITSFVADPWGS
ncbi:uncharacterized protein LOC131153965 [Malania oleifera]|uniref:uncharacterized protein LOC131153965 n=1 Tax=Malania oleifera TaxID=397392 RepID=UPI0025AE0B11|nr:uncharacterized protein LOC131153965 [Malania oleifera]